MPLYDYRCPVCGAIIESFGSYDEDIKMRQCCSSLCNGEQQNFYRIISGKPPVIIFKGDGWAKDNYTGKSNNEK